MSTPELRFSAEYQCYPIWVTKPGGGEDNPDPRTLGLSEELSADVVRWADDFDSRFDVTDFSAPLFVSAEDERSFDARGRRLAQQVAQALRGRYVVRYRSVSDGAWVTLG
jgi:hypothetical protein